jgi:hypothetical protein
MSIKIIVEAILVGIYCDIIYAIIGTFIYSGNLNLFLFILGFSKHLFGFLLNLQLSYCIYGEACSGFNNNGIDYNIIQLYADSCIEGFLFIFVGRFLDLFIKNKYLLFFILGCTLHISSEIIGYHAYFCKFICKKTTS